MYSLRFSPAGYEVVTVRHQMSVENIGIEIRAIGPRDRTEFVIHSHLRKVSRIFERCKYAAKTDDGSQIDYAFDTVFIANAEAVTVQWTCRNDIFQHKKLLQRRNRLEFRFFPRQRPVFQ